MPPVRFVPFLALLTAAPAWAVQANSPDDAARRARPERPTVATHAFAVARGHVEVEAGVAATTGAGDGRSATTLAKIGIADRLQLSLAATHILDGQRSAAEQPLFAGVKWQLGSPRGGRPAFALLPGVTVARDGGEGALSLMAIATHDVGSAGLDFNFAATRLNGGRGAFPHLWAVAATLPLAGRFGWGVELSGERAPQAPSATAHALGFVTASFGPSLVLDAGWTRAVRGGDDAALFAGVTWNVGRRLGATGGGGRD